jgi:hypothetical protein
MPGQLRAPLGGIQLLVYIPPQMSALEAIYYVASTLPERERAAFTAETIAKFKAAGGVIADGETPHVAEPRPVAAKAETTGRAKKQPRKKAPGEQDFTTLRRKAVLRALKRDWSNPELSPDERRRLAKNIVQTYERAREGDADFYDHSAPLRAAQKLMNEGKNHRRKARAAALVSAGLS